MSQIGIVVGYEEGDIDGTFDDTFNSKIDGSADGVFDGFIEGLADGTFDGFVVGALVGTDVDGTFTIRNDTAFVVPLVPLALLPEYDVADTICCCPGAAVRLTQVQ